MTELVFLLNGVDIIIGSTVGILGEGTQYLLAHKCRTVSKANPHLPGPDFVDRIFSISDRPMGH